MRIAFLAFLPSLLFSQSPNPARDSSASLARDLVNPFIGTGGHGHTFPGACVPNGLVQLSPDTRPDGVMDWDGCGGYHYSDSLIYGFSHTHLSGTGVADLCDVLLMPYSSFYGDRTEDHYVSGFKHSSEAAHAGYYSVELTDAEVRAELTASSRVGVHRYTFSTDKDAWIMLDLKHRDKLLSSGIQITSRNEITGRRRSSSWAKDQQVFFCIRTSISFAEISFGISGSDTTSLDLQFGKLSAPLIVKVGISAVSIEGARANLDAEVPHWDFDLVRKQAEEAWNAKLNKIKIEGGTKEQQRIFYTALYHCYVAPYIFNDVDGHYRGMDGEVHHADHNVYTVFSLWDTFRALHPLMTILEPEMTSDFIKTFLLHYQQGGRLPVWELWGNETDCMIGYHSVSVIADAYLKGIRGFDADLALEAMVASAMRDEPGLNAYRAKGYISSEDQSESVSKTLEYAYDDWCIASYLAARKLHRTEDHSTFQRRSYSYESLYDPASGFFRARRNGGFVPGFDPFEVNFNFTEANAWQYSLFVPQNITGMLGMHGGNEGLTLMLDQLFTVHGGTSGREQADITGLIGQYAHGNEPSHHMAYLYARSGQPEKTRAMVKRIMDEMYHDAPDGLSGNEDCGQMSAWYVMSALGFYQISPGINREYDLGYPLFDRATIHLSNGKSWSMIVAADDQWLSSVPKDTTDLTGYYPRRFTHDDLILGGDFMFDFDRAPRRQYKRKSYGPTVLDGAYYSPGGMFLGAPVINASSASFNDQLEVLVQGRGTCTVSDNDGKRNCPVNAPFMIGSTSTIEVVWNEAYVPVTAHLSKIDGTRSITLESTYANQYSAGGDRALIDGLRGGEDFRTGEWQGYQGQDVVLMIDLGKMVDLKRVGLSALQDQKSWIWLPSEVIISTSVNQRQWSSTTVTHDVDPKAEGGILRELWTGLLGRKARYIAITAKNAGPCPEWHPGKGGATWIFVDEVLIEVMP
ncbi:MAG: GH92 family glycosyl hydrolase [Flavobacteriales bacterium]|nr:GH92 family glycosyl hydrolase [Flavobacteriales bacterium]